MPRSTLELKVNLSYLAIVDPVRESEGLNDKRERVHEKGQQTEQRWGDRWR